jgi:pyruvate dehydrogenase E2 component (dihydrolipoamide acetyltransferase)
LQPAAAASTFTITNPGALGSILSQPIINKGETSILCLDGIEQRPVVVDREIVIRRRAYVSLAFDHRVVDGAMALGFLGHLRGVIEAGLPA